MKKFLLLLIFPVNLLFAQQKDYITFSKEIFDHIRNREFSKVTENFDTNISARIDTTRLKTTWDKLSPLVGKYVKTDSVSTNLEDHKNIIVIQHLKFEKRKIDFKLVYGETGKIRGILFLPDQTYERYKLPDYYKPGTIKDSSVSIRNGPFNLPGIFTRPDKEGRFPLVIMIHGTGPNDKDETVGPMKIFKDFSIGLASQGVSVYRYEKRTRVYKATISLNKTVTVNDETIEDVILAVSILKNNPYVDTNQIYLCGHGMGGMLLPRIVRQIPGIKGLIYICPNARPVEDIIYDQTAYSLKFDTTIKNPKHFLDSVKRESAKIKTLKVTDRDSSKIFNFPRSYWMDLNNYNPVKTAQGLTLPMLFLFGERDYQVTKVDADLWKNGLKGPNVEYKNYPDLNHFLIYGKGKSTPLEYSKTSNVDINVLNDVSAWILLQKK